MKHDSGLQESKQNASVFEGLPTMKSRHIELSIAADGNFIHTDSILFSSSVCYRDTLHLGSPRLRYSHNASGPVRGYLPLKDAICSDVSQHGQHAAVFCVPSDIQIFKASSCSVDQETTAKGDSGFQFKDGCRHVTFPYGMFSVCFVSKLPHTLSKFSSGPTTLLANHIVGDPIASDLHCGAAYWTFEMRENRCS